MAELARPAAAAVARRLTQGQLSDGPVVMWAAVISLEGTLLAAAPVPGPGVWAWEQGGLITRLPPTTMPVIARGPIAGAWLIAVTGHQWAPITPLILEVMPPAVMGIGDIIILRDAKIRHNFGGDR